MRDLSGDKEGKIVALSMGPPMAEEVLRYGLSRLTDAAVLLTDRSLGGADTVATANPLAFATRKIVKEIFKGNDDYYVVSGMQSVDGDTAQVPPQIAEELGLPCVAYVTAAEFKKNHFEFTRIISGGSQVVRVKKLPAVITVAKYEWPLFATFAGTRKANRMEIIRWGADDIKATHIGVKGSKTRVIRVFPPGKSTRKCQQIDDVRSLAELMSTTFDTQDAGKTGNGEQSAGYVPVQNRTSWCDRSYEGTEKERKDFKILAETLSRLGINGIGGIGQAAKEKILAEAGGRFHEKALEDMLEGLKLTKPSYSGEVWVVAEHNGGVVHPATFELIGKARELADCLETQTGVCLAGFELEPMTRKLIAAGGDNIYVIEDEMLRDFYPGAYRKVVADCIKKHSPQIVLFAATPRGRMLAPMVSYRIGCGLTADCTSFDIRDSSRKGQTGILLQTRPALGGNVMATICTKDSLSQMATARPGVMKRLPADYSRKGEVIRHSVEISDSDIATQIIKTELGTGDVNFGAEVIVSGGKGMQNRDSYNRLVGALCEGLAEKLGTGIEKGASRAAVEQGFIERVHQVGQTGTAVGPKLYVALGISGAIQHMIGIANSQTIVAINSDPNAPIFRQCDYYIVGNVEDVVPQLVEALNV